ncbi:MAG TPA: Pvc16 family protein [Vicinamibacterales bacterium]
MFQLLDDTLRRLLDDPAIGAVFPELLNADVSFVAPEKGQTPSVDAINLFLYETRENRDVRELTPMVTVQNGISRRRRAPLRVDCCYLVTAWAKGTGGAKVAKEHQLLGQAFNWLSRFPEIPDRYLLPAGLTNQVYRPWTLVAQLDAVRTVGDFWTALGIAPRPFFNVIVTICMDLDVGFDDPIVTTIMTSYFPLQDPAAREEHVFLGGTVRDNLGAPVANAWVRLEPAGLTQVSDDKGRFIFGGVARGAGMTLRARASGRPEAVRTAVEVPSATQDYDLQFS